MHEQIPAGSEVQWIDTDPGENLLDFNTQTGDATVLIGAGTTIVYYDNEPTPPSGTGWHRGLQERPSGLVAIRTRPARTTSPSPTPLVRTYQLSVLAGQCSEPIQVAAGVNEIVETPKAGTDLTDVVAFPWDRLLTVNLINRTATVEVPVSANSTDETQVHFRNEAQRGQLKVCARPSAAAARIWSASTFDFDSLGRQRPVGQHRRSPQPPRPSARSSASSRSARRSP